MNNLMEQRAAKVTAARALVKAAEEAGRNLSAEERTQYDALIGEIDTLSERIEREVKLNGLASQMTQSQGRQTPAIGMSQREVQRYSLVRAINAAIQNDWRGAELEREASEAMAKRLNRQPQGFFVPYEVQQGGEQRDQTKGTNTAGGYLVSTDLLASSFIDLLTNRMVLRSAGVTMLTGLVGDIAIPKVTAGTTAYWVAESGAPTESAVTYGQVAMTPKTVGGFVDLSRKLLKQSSIDVEAFTRTDLSRTLALEIDRVGFHGSGSSNQPTGVAATSGIGSVVGGTNGAAPDWADIIDLETAVAQDNADIGRLSYITNAKVRGKLKQTAKVSSTDSMMVWAEGSTPLNGYPVWVTNQVSSALTKGSSSTCSAIFFGNWADLVIGMWGGLDILVDPYTYSTSGTVRVTALQDIDIAVRRAESFAAMLDATTS